MQILGVCGEKLSWEDLLSVPKKRKLIIPNLDRLATILRAPAESASYSPFPYTNKALSSILQLKNINIPAESTPYPPAPHSAQSSSHPDPTPQVQQRAPLPR